MNTVWISKKELSSRLGISIGSITKLVYQDGMPHLKIGRRIQFNYELVLSWFEKRGQLRRS